jgi:hypothetical protein
LAFFFDSWTSAARLANALFNRADAGTQLRESASDGRTAEPGNPRHDHETPATAPQRENAGEEAPLAFVEARYDAVDRLVLAGSFTKRLVLTFQAGASVHGALQMRVCHDCSRLP